MSQDLAKMIDDPTIDAWAFLRHLSRYRLDIAFAVNEVSKTLASLGDADLRRLRRLGRYLLGTQQLGIMIRKSNDPEHLDAYTDADWSGDSINRKSTSGGVLKVGSATLREFTKSQSCQTLSRGESEYYAAVSTTAESLHLQRLLKFLGNAGQATIANRFNSSTRHHAVRGVRSPQAYRDKTLVPSSGSMRKRSW